MTCSEVIYKAEGLSRVLTVSLDSKESVAPMYFPAISSAGVKHGASHLVELLTSHSYPRLLISAYDLHRMDPDVSNSIRQKLFESPDITVFLDSGMFESYWFQDTAWTFDEYSRIAKWFPFDIYTSLDMFPLVDDPSSGFVKTSIKRIEESRKILDKPGFAAVIHGMHPQTLASMVQKTLKGLDGIPNIVAVAERDCGMTILERARTVTQIRRELDRTGQEIVLHILGCGNPKSLAVYIFCGSDSFDSLDWIKYAVNPSTNALSDPSYLEFMDCDCSVCKGVPRDYVERVLLHNLMYYQELMKEVRTAIRDNTISDYIAKRFGKDVALVAEKATRGLA